ncbi:hypothetical protein IL306_009513 [Fusarium sp. DS 682]|nr:hypothetical protein IL306_009513 [Fusarium sp. DS 682]
MPANLLPIIDRIIVTDPWKLSKNKDQGRLKWLLEQHSTSEPYETAKANDVLCEVEEYGKSLVDQLQLAEFVGLMLMIRSPKEYVEELMAIQIEDSGPESMFHSIHWEALEHMYSWSACGRQKHKIQSQVQKRSVTSDTKISAESEAIWSIAGNTFKTLNISESRDKVRNVFCAACVMEAKSQRILVQRTVNPTIPQSLTRQDSEKVQSALQRPFNILLVASRPNREDDITPLLGSRAVVETLRSLPESQSNRVVFDVARPGTFKALDAHLSRTSKAWHRQGGVGAWFDMVLFDVHGCISNGTAYLSFLSSSGNREHRVRATEVANLLSAHSIETACLISCESAKVTPNASSNLARIFVETGLCSVLAMSFKFTASAANAFLRSFFSHLLAQFPVDIARSLVKARHALITAPLRDAVFGLRVVLPDYLVPVLYVNTKLVPSRRVPALDPIHDKRRDLQALAIKTYEDHVGTLVDREQYILEIEPKLLKAVSRRSARALLLQGMVGIGKSAIAKFLRWWWPFTEFCMASTYLDMSTPQSFSILRSIMAVWTMPVSMDIISDTTSQVFIIDNLDRVTSLAPDTTKAAIAEAEECRKIIKDWLRLIKEKQVFILFTSRSRETWLVDEGVRTLEILKLSSFGAAELTTNVLRKMGVGEEYSDIEGTRYLTLLASHLGNNPLAIKEYLPVLQRQANMRREQIHQPVSTPFLLYNHLQNGSTRPYQDHSGLILVRDLLKLCDSTNPNMKRVLLGLSPLWNVFGEDWFDALEHWFPQYDQEVPSREEINTFLEKHLLDSGWMQVVRLPKGSLHDDRRYYRVHPLLSLAFRQFNSMLDMQSNEDWSERTSKVFMVHFCLRGAKYFSSSQERIDIKPQLLLECSNFLRSVELQILNFQQLRIVLGDKLVTKSIGYVLFRLWELARSGEVQHLNVSVLTESSERFLELLQSPSAGIDVHSDDAIISFTGVSLALADHFTFRNLAKAIGWAESCNKVMLAGPEPWKDREANVLQALSLTLKAYGQLPQPNTRDDERAEKACQYASQALETLSAMGTQAVELGDVRDHSFLIATTILRHMAPLSTSFCNACDKYDENYEEVLEKYKLSLGKDSAGFGAPMALAKQLARRDWWFQQLGVNQRVDYGSRRAAHRSDDSTSKKGDHDMESERLLSDLRLAMSTGDKVAEFQLQDSLIRYYEGKKNWKTAAEHIIELHKLAAEAAAPGRDQHHHPIDLSSFNNFDTRLRHGCILVEAESFDEAQRLYDKLINDVLDTCSSKEKAEEKTGFIPGKTWAWLMQEGSSWDIIMQAQLSLNIASKIKERWPGM